MIGGGICDPTYIYVLKTNKLQNKLHALFNGISLLDVSLNYRMQIISRVEYPI